MLKQDRHPSGRPDLILPGEGIEKVKKKARLSAFRSSKGEISARAVNIVKDNESPPDYSTLEFR